MKTDKITCEHGGEIVYVCDGKGKCCDCGMILSPNRLGEISARREIKELKAKLAKAEANILQIHKDLGCELSDPCGTIWQHADKVQNENAALKAKLEEMILKTNIIKEKA